MVELKVQYPYIDNSGASCEKLIKHYAEDENGDKYYIIQEETGIKYEETIDVYPCRYTYKSTNEKIEHFIKEEEGNGKD